MKEQQTMTLVNAIADGYTRYCTEQGDCGKLEVEETIPWEQIVYLIEKKQSVYRGPDERTIAEILAENAYCEWGEMVNTDDDKVYDIVHALDYTQVAQMITKALEDMIYYPVTDIKLVKE